MKKSEENVILSSNDSNRRVEKMLRADPSNFPILVVHLIVFSLKGEELEVILHLKSSSPHLDLVVNNFSSRVGNVISAL